MSSRTSRTPIIEVGGEPRINFLPPEIQNRKDARRRRRALFMLVLAIAVLCAIGYTYAAQYATGRHDALEAEQKVTLDLLAQQSTYTEARMLATRVALTNDAISVTSSTEVFWQGLIVKMRAVFPADARATQWTTTSLSALDSAAEPSGLFPVSSVATVEVSVVVGSLNTVSALLNNLRELPGVVSVGLSNVTADEEVGLGTIITVEFDSSIYEGRFREGWVPSVTPPPAPVEQKPEGSDSTVDGATSEGEGEQ
ncbi:MAG: hypothetical protein IT190_02520 [Microbacteriaceae bacterium]|nr:hypothetical protein [Microbacteriaceae bacterium]